MCKKKLKEKMDGAASIFNLDSNRLSILLLFRRFFFLFSAIVFLFFLFCVWPKRKIKQRRLFILFRAQYYFSIPFASASIFILGRGRFFLHFCRDRKEKEQKKKTGKNEDQKRRNF